MSKIIEADNIYLDKWDDFVESSINGTIFHRRDFLSYHKNRFKDKERWILIVDKDKPIAQIALTIDKTENTIIAKSPYGGSYGGFIFQKYPSYNQGNVIVELLVDYLRQNNVERFLMTPPIACCSDKPLDTFYFNLLKAGFKYVNFDVSSVVIIQKNTPVESTVSNRAKRMAKKAIKSGIFIKNRDNPNVFWKVLEKTFAKHQGNPTHTFDEFKTIMNLLPDRIYVDIAYKNDIPVSGIGYFVVNKNMMCSFYLCQDSAYQQYQGLSLLLLSALEHCQREGYKFFDLGTSTVNMKARENVFSFKENYSKIGMFRQTFELNLTD